MFDITWKNKNFEHYVETKDWYGNKQYNYWELYQMGIDLSLYIRISHWMQLIDGIIKSPILGLGASITGGSADGNYVRILSESGAIGILIWISLLRKINKDFKYADSNFVFLKYSFISILIGAITIDLFEASKIMMIFWFLLGCYYANIQKIEEKEYEDKECNNNK